MADIDYLAGLNPYAEQDTLAPIYQEYPELPYTPTTQDLLTGKYVPDPSNDQVTLGGTPQREPFERKKTIRDRMLDSVATERNISKMERQAALKENPLVKGFGQMGENFIEAPSGLANAVMDALEGDTKFSDEFRNMVEIAVENGDLLVNPVKGAMLGGTKAMSNILIRPGTGRILQRKLDALDKIAVPNPTNMLQQVAVISDAQRFGIPMVKTFDPSDVPATLSGMNLAPTSSHRTALGTTMGNIAKMRGESPFPIYTERYDLKGPTEFGSGTTYLPSGKKIKQNYLEGGYIDPETGLPIRKQATTNQEALNISTGSPHSTDWYLPQGGVIDYRNVPTDEIIDVNKSYRKLLRDTDMKDILAGIEQTPRFRGDPRLYVDEQGALPTFEMYPQGYVGKDAARAVNEDEFYKPRIFSDERAKNRAGLSVRDEWSTKILEGVGMKPKPRTNLELVHHPEAMERIESLHTSNDPVMRWVADKVTTGQISAIANGRVNPNFLEDLDRLMFQEQDAIQKARGTIRTNDPRNQIMLGGEANPEYEDWVRYNAERGMITDGSMGDYSGYDERRIEELNDWLSGKTAPPIWIKLLGK